MPISLQAVGQVQSEHSVQIRPQVSGMLQEVYFKEGPGGEQGPATVPHRSCAVSDRR